MKLRPFKLIAVLVVLCCRPLLAEPLDAASEALNDPTVMTETLERGLGRVLVPVDKTLTPTPGKAANTGELQDPTRMNQNFREALKRVAPSNAGTPSGDADAGSVLPEIQLLASVCGMHKDKNHAMLRVNEKTEMVGLGDKITTVKNNQIIEIRVLEIDKNQIKVEVLPANETIILR